MDFNPKSRIGSTLSTPIGPLVFSKVIGQGSFAVVYQATAKIMPQPPPSSSSSSSPFSASTNIRPSSYSAPSSIVACATPVQHIAQYAIKTLYKGNLNAHQLDIQRMECTLHTRVSGHPNIVKLAGVVEDDTWLYLILEWWTGGDLFDALVELSSDMKYPVSSDTQSLMYALSNPVDALEIFLKLVDAVDHCHDHGVYHRDLKPENIMLRKVVKQPVYQHHHPQHHHHHYQYHNEIAYWEPGIADFGLATSALTSTEFGCGSLRYMSPECLGDSSSSSTRSSRQPSNHTTSSSAASAAALSISTSLQEKEKKFTNYLSPVPDSTSATPIVPCSNNNNSNNNNGRAIRGMDADCLIGEVASFDDNLLPSSLPVCSALTAIAPSSPSKGELVHSTALAAASHAPYPTAANDVWALGVILVNLLTSRNPWCEPSIADYMFADFVREARHHALIDFFKYQFGLASPIGRILEGCFELDPENRWNVSMLRMAVEEVLEEQMDILYYNHPGNKMESPVQSPAIVGSYSNPSSIVLPSSSSSAAARRRSSATDKMVEFDPIHEEQDENSNNCITSQQQNVPDDMSSHGHNGNQLNNSTGDYRFSHKTTAPINADTRSSKSRQSTDSSHSWASDGSSEMDFDSIPSFSDGVTYVRYASSAPSTSLFMNSKVAAAVAVGLVASSPTAVPVAKTSTSNSTAVTTAVNVTTTPTSSTPSFGTTRTSIVSANTVPASSSGSASLLLSSASALDAVVSSSAFPAVTKNPSSMVSELSAAVSKMNNNEAIVAAAAVGIAKKGYYEEDLFMDDEHQHPSNDSFGDTHDYNDEEEEDDDDEEEQEEGKDHVNLALSVKRRTSTSTSPAATTTTTTSKPIAIPVRKSVSEHHLNNAEMDGLSDRMMGKHRMTTCEKPIAYNGSTAVTISSAAAPCTPPKSDSINVNSNSAITHSESKKKKKKKPKKKKKASSMSAVGVSGSISDMSALTDLLGSPSKVQPVPAPSIQAQHNINKELQQQQPSSSNATISSSSINNSNPTITNNNTSNRKPSRNHPSRIVHRASPNVVATPSRAPPGEPQYSLPQADVVNALRGLMRGILNLHHHHQGFSAAAAMQPQVPPGGFGIHHHHHHQQQLTMQMTSNSTVAAAAGGGPSVAANALLGGIPVHLRSRSGIQVFSITFFHNQQQPPLPPPQSRS